MDDYRYVETNGLTIGIDPEFESLIPPLSDDEITRLEASIVEEGCRDSLVLWAQPGRGTIPTLLDGHNRLQICARLGIPFNTVTRTFEERLEAEEWIIQNQLGRRNLLTNDRNYLQGRLKLDHGAGPGKPARVAGLGQVPGQTNAELAKSQGVSERTLLYNANFARQLDQLDIAYPGFREAVRRETIPIGRDEVAQIAKLPVEEQAKVVEAAMLGHLSTDNMRQAIRRIRNERSYADRIQRAQAPERANEVGRLTDRTYPIIVADPPWDYGFSQSDSRSVEAHYPTLTDQEIADLEVDGRPVRELARDAAVLYLWVPNTKCAEGVHTAIAKAWGFTPKTMMAWKKDRIGSGYWVREIHENVLIAVRGDFPPPLPERRRPSFFEAPRGSHFSDKPEEINDMVDTEYSELYDEVRPNFLELFSRERRDGWDGWGYDYPDEEASA